MDRSPLIWILKKTPNQVGNEGGCKHPKNKQSVTRKTTATKTCKNQTKKGKPKGSTKLGKILLRKKIFMYRLANEQIKANHNNRNKRKHKKRGEAKVIDGDRLIHFNAYRKKDCGRKEMRRSQKGSRRAGSLIVENIIWLNVFKVANYLNGLVIGTWIIRSYNPNEIGMYGYAIAGSEIITSIAGLGVNLPLLRELKKKKEAEEELISAATMIYILSAIILYILFLLFGAQQERLELKLLVAITGIKILLAISNIYRIWYLSKIQSRVFVKAQIISLAIASSIKVIALTNGLSIVIVGMADITGLATRQYY